MNELVTVEARDLIKQIVETKGSCVPAVIDDVRKTLLFTATKARMLREALKGIESIEGAGEMHEALVEQRDAASIAEVYMTARLGEITREMPTKARGAARLDTSVAPKTETLSTQGVDKHVYKDAERIAKNEWAIEEELEEKQGSNRGPTKSGVLNRIREREAASHAAKKRERAEDRAVKERPRLVAEYLDATKHYREALELAIAGAKRDRFDPTAWNFITTKHEQLRGLMKTLEDLV